MHAAGSGGLNLLLMPAEIQLTETARRVHLRRNPKDPQTMAMLEEALKRLNDLEIQDLEDPKTEFAIQ